MTAKTFKFHHPTAYDRLLTAGCLGMLMCGLVSVALGRQPAQAATDWQLVSNMMTPVTVPAAANATPAQTLPGADGTTTQAQAQADTTPAPAAPRPAVVVADALTNNGDMRSLGRSLNAAAFGDQYWEALNQLWTRESSWNPLARNGSGACGIPQALPCSKISDQSPQGQIGWGLGYIRARYGNPANAWSHEVRYGWY